MIITYYKGKCPNCSFDIQINEMSSGNTWDAKLRSDGKLEGPMLIETDLIVKCPYCNKIFLNEEFKQQKDIDYRRFPFNNVKQIRKPSWRDYYRFLKTSKFETEIEILLRKSLLWKINDLFCFSHFLFNINNVLFNIKRCHYDNLKTLENLLSLTKEELFLLVEVKRELSKFEEAKKLLDENSFDINSSIIKEMRSFIIQKDSKVRYFSANISFYIYIN